MRSSKTHDITIRMRRKDGHRTTAQQAKAALWAAHKRAQRGEEVELRDWIIEAVDWRKGSGREYSYTGSRAAEAIANMGGILETVGMDGLRVEVPDVAQR